MANQTLSQSIPPEWQEKFLIKRIGEEDIEISLEERDAILKALVTGARFIQIGKYTLMINAIKSIDPKIEPDNIPYEPLEKLTIEQGFENGTFYVKEIPNPKHKLWHELYDPLSKVKRIRGGQNGDDQKTTSG